MKLSKAIQLPDETARLQNSRKQVKLRATFTTKNTQNSFQNAYDDKLCAF